MKTAIINFKTDPALKRKAQKKADELGISLSTALNAYLRRFLRAKDIDFVEDELVPTAYLEKELKVSEKDIEAGRVSPHFKTTKEMAAWLNDDNARYANGDSVK